MRTGNKFAPAKLPLHKDGKRRYQFNDYYGTSTCRLLAYGHDLRAPWSYQMLSMKWIAALLGTEFSSTKRKLGYLLAENYLHVWEHQLLGVSLPYIIRIHDNGFKAVGCKPDPDARVSFQDRDHALLSNLEAADFEIGARNNNCTIEVEDLDLQHSKPDWYIFRLKTPHHSFHVCIEADMATEKRQRKDGYDLKTKIRHYLLDMQNYKDLIICFWTIEEYQVKAILESVYEVINEEKLHRKVALRFCVQLVEYRRGPTKLPDPTGRAVTGDWQRAFSKHPFNFLKAETWKE
jgi:hypothetical protein